MTSDAETSEIDRAVGSRLIIARGLLTQAEFGRRIGMTASAIGKYERGDRSPAPMFFQKVAEEYGISPSWLITGNGPMLLGDEPVSGEDDATVALPSTADLIAQEAHRPIYDRELMGRITSAIAKLYRAERVTLPDVDLGRLAMQGYAEIVKEAEDPDEYPARIELMVVRLRKALRTAAAAPDTSKRRA